jgi:hypothetical protein
MVLPSAPRARMRAEELGRPSVSAMFTENHPARSERWVAAIYGWDLLSGHPRLDPESLIADGFEVLALDRPAIAKLLELELPFRTPEDWLNATGMDPAGTYSSSSRASDGWSDHHSDSITSDGLHWPDHDHWQVPETWLTLTVGLSLATAFQRAGVTRLRFSSKHPEGARGVRECPLRALADLWQRILPDAADPVIVDGVDDPRALIRIRRAISETPLGEPLRAARSRLDSRHFFASARSALEGIDRSRLVLLLLPARELDRSAPIISLLRDHLGPTLIAAPWMDAKGLTSEAGRLNAVPWLPTPPLERGFLSDERRLAAGVGRNLAAHDLGDLESARPEIDAALRTLSTGWAAHARRLRWTVDMLRRIRPALVVTARDAISYQVPTEAAQLAGVPVITLPHGVVEWSPQGVLAPRCGIVHVGGIRNPTDESQAIQVCRDIMITHEYPRRVREFVQATPRTAVQILVLTEGYLGWNSPSVLARSHQRALQIIAEASARAAVGTEFMLKPHPADPDDEQALMLEGMRPGTKVVVLPREADTLAAIAASDLVVGLNYVGSAMVHAVMQGCPAIRISTSHALLSAEGEDWANWTKWAEFWDRALLSVASTAELLETVQRVHRDPAFVEELRQRSHDAAAALRPDADAPSIIDVVEEILATRTAQNS